MAASVRIEHLSHSGTSLREKTIEILARTIGERCGIPVTRAGDGELGIQLVVEPGIGREGFRIESADGGAVRIVGNDERGLLYGVGKLLRG